MYNYKNQSTEVSQHLSHPVTLSVCIRGGGGHEDEPVPSILVLPGPAFSLSGLHGALLRVPEIHQTEVQSGLVNTSGNVSTIKHTHDIRSMTVLIL